MPNWIKTPEGFFKWGDGDPIDPADAFGPDFNAMRDRVASLEYFTGVTDVQSAAQAIEEAEGIPPMAFLSTASETAQSNKTIGGHAQRVTTRLSVMFAIMTDRAAGDGKDAAEQLRKALVLILAGWTPPGAAGPLQFDRYLPRAMGDGLFWGEVLFVTEYRLTTR
jgi:hypothetical protein